ncbi:MAG: S9 family peptidase [Alphaproteobacteria bacterium]|nr:MAG: S9 family peptidase [Alphaproteobacteria bacterium]
MFFKQFTKSAALVLGLMAPMLPTPATAAQEASVEDTLPIDKFAMLPVIQQVSVSPDGKHMGVMRAQNKDGNYIIEIYKTSDLKKRPVRLGSGKMEFTGFIWANNERLLVNFRQNIQAGKDNYWASRWASMGVDGKGRWEYLPETSSLSIIDILPDNPDEILISYDMNDNYIDDVARFNVNTGRTVTVIRGSDKMSGFYTDREGEVRGAGGFDVGEKSIKYYLRGKGETNWKLVKTVHSDSETREDFDILGFSSTNGDEVYVRANQGEDKSGIYVLNIKTGEYSERLFGLASVDAGGIIMTNKPGDRGRLIGFSYTTDEAKRYLFDEQEAALQKALEGQFPGKRVVMTSRSDDDNAIVIFTTSDKDPGTYYLLKDKSRLDFLGTEFPLLTADMLPDRTYTKFKARDGMEIPAYITKPKGDGPWPAVVMPHGGPWSRDTGGYDEWAAVLANHGYVVIQPQFRGSQGFGLALWKAGDAKWGLEMQDDVDDAAMHLVELGYATKDHLAIFGWSYGGYSAFAGSMRDNNIYQCAIAGAGVADLKRLNAGLHDNLFLRKLQRPTIKGVSPLDQVEKVNVPIMVVHGDIDQRVPVSHSRDFVSRLEKLGKDYRYVELEGADHFYNTLYLRHKRSLYTNLLDWLDNHCGNN